MKTNTTYEWDIETMEEEDITDHNHSDLIPTEQLMANEVLVLVRDSGRDSRSWAYCENGKMDAVFRDAFGHGVCTVPKRFISEFEKSIHAK